MARKTRGSSLTTQIYAQHVNPSNVPQTEPLTPDQVANDGGGYGWVVDDWVLLNRFLILGTEKGTYYVKPRKATVEAADAVCRCIAADGLRVVNEIVKISESGRAPKNDHAIFALALAASKGSSEVQDAALAALPRVCRIGTHLFSFCAAIKTFRGNGRKVRRALVKWYNNRKPDRLALQLVKYQSRGNWSHRDVLKVCHPRATSIEHSAAYFWAIHRQLPSQNPELAKVYLSSLENENELFGLTGPLARIGGFEEIKQATKAKDVVRLIRDYKLPRECVPTQWLNAKSVWESLLEEMPMTAMVRNLGKMSSLGMFTGNTEQAKLICSRLRDQEKIRNERVHPIALLIALKTYESGNGMRGHLTWSVNTGIVDALQDAFYLAFGNVEPTNKKLVLALDVSGSMAWNGSVAGVENLSAREACAAMALVTAAVESDVTFVGFSDEIVELNISPKQRLDDVIRTISAIPMGYTDCAAPMLWAQSKGLDVDAFVAFTDSETNSNSMHPSQAMADYRKAANKPRSKLVVVATEGRPFTIADPNDPGMLDCVGFDTATPNIISDFVMQ